jgi:hypothetical protein
MLDMLVSISWMLVCGLSTDQTLMVMIPTIGLGLLSASQLMVVPWPLGHTVMMLQVKVNLAILKSWVFALQTFHQNLHRNQVLSPHQDLV